MKKTTLVFCLCLVLAASTSFAKTNAVQSTQPVKPIVLPDTGVVSSIQLGTATSQKIKDIPLSDMIKINLGGKPIELKRVTQGLRQKKVALFWASVYVAQIFSNSKIETTSIEGLRNSLLKGLPTVVSMTFLRNIDIKKILDGYKEVFTENGIKTEVTPYSKFLEAVQKTGDVKDGQTYYFVFSGDEKKAGLSFWTNGKEQFSINDGDTNVLGNFLKMWMGKAPDSGLEQLQGYLLKPDKI